MGKPEDISKYIGKTYGRLTILEEVEPSKGHRRVLCECNCVDKTIDVYFLGNLKRGLTVSCGCYNKEALSINKKTHGLRKHPIYNVWASMKQRCFNEEAEAYKNYGGRGITICEEWVNSFQTFYDWAITNGWEKGLEIDREDNDGNYEPDNCHFITPQENVWNRRLLNGLNKSGYCGINFNGSGWVCRVAYKNERTYLGCYKTAQSAAFVRDKYCVENAIPLPLNFTWLDPNIENQSGWIY